MKMIWICLLYSCVQVVTLVSGQECGPFTSRDTPGPFFVETNVLNSILAPQSERQDPSQAAILRGKVLDKDCRPVTGATVDVWYAGGGKTARGVHYTFAGEELLYRGKTITTSKTGSYRFAATFPGVYTSRPIPHYHMKVTTPGGRGQSFITQVYFRDMVPQDYRNYVRTRGSQFGKIEAVNFGLDGMDNGGRVVNFNIRLS